MAAKPLSADQHRAIIAAVRNHVTISAAAKALGLPRATAETRWTRAKEWAKANNIAVPTKPETGTAPALPADSLSVKGDSAELSRMTDARIKSLADLIRVCEIDTSEWEVERYVCNKWDMGYKDADAEAHALPLFQVKAWLKRKVHIVNARAEIAALLDEAATKMPRRVTIIRALKSPTRILFEPQIPDLHAGKLAWGDETGWEHYDLSTAVALFDASLDVLIARSRSFGADRVLLPLGNDLLHSDTKAGTTTGGTPLDNDSRFHKVFAAIRRMSVRAIDRCREEIGPVKVILVPGNHDTLANWHLGDSLECWYRKDKGVEIDNSPRLRKYHQHGKVMLLHTHGNRGKLDAYPQIMASEEPRMWGDTIHREAHTGDKHHQRVLEMKGCTVRISRALCPPDAWHSEMHFIGSARGAESFNWHPEEGLIGASFTTVPGKVSDGKKRS